MQLNKHIYLLTALISTLFHSVVAQAQLGIGTTTPHQSAVLDIVSDKQGFLPPRMTTIQRDAIAEPSEGLVIYNTTDKCLQYWDSETWKCSANNVSTPPSELCFNKPVKSFHNDNYGPYSKVGNNFLIGTDGGLWYWGTASSYLNKNEFFPEGTGNYLHDNSLGFTSPFKINLPEPIKKIRTTAAGVVFALSETGKLYAWGDDSNYHLGVFGQGSSKRASPNSTNTFPPENLSNVIGANNTVIDFDLWEMENHAFWDSEGTTVVSVIISSDGKAYFAGTGTGGAYGDQYRETYVVQKSWAEIKTPHSGSYPKGFPTNYDSAGFKYTKAFGGNNIVLEGENNLGEKIYFAFGTDAMGQRLLLNENYNNVSGSTFYKNSVHPNEYPLHVQLPPNSTIIDANLGQGHSVFKLDKPNTFYYAGTYFENISGSNQAFIPLEQPISSKDYLNSKFTRKPIKIDLSGIAQGVTVNDIIYHHHSGKGFIAATSAGLYSVGQTSSEFPQFAILRKPLYTPFTAPITSNEPTAFFNQWTLAKHTEDIHFKKLKFGVHRLLMLDAKQQLRLYANLPNATDLSVPAKARRAAAGIGTNKSGITLDPTCLANPALDTNYK